MPVHLVGQRTFHKKLNTLNLNPEPGECLLYNRGEDGAAFGNETCCPRFTGCMLTTPSGKTKELENIREWYEIGNMSCHLRHYMKEEIVTDEAVIYNIVASH